jgi:DNA-binding response OmpR family regulator
MRRILVVATDSDIRFFLEVVLQTAGYQVLAAADAGAVAGWSDSARPDLLVLELTGIRVEDAEDVLDRIGRRGDSPPVKVLVISGDRGHQHLGDGALQWPVASGEILREVRRLITEGKHG